MGAITLTNFGGIVPRTSPRLTADNAAQIAVNCKLSSGELVPFNAPKKVASSGKAPPLRSIYRIYEDGDATWLTWPHDVDVVKAPLFGKARWCFTGDGAPKITTFAAATGGGGNALPNNAFTLGIPRPAAAPVVNVSGGSGATVNRYYVYTFYSDWDGVELEGAVSPVSVVATGFANGTWSITGMNATPANSGSCSGVFASGFTTVTTTVPHWLRVGDEVVLLSATLIVSEVLSATQFKVAGNYASATSWARKAPFPGTIFKRLYRTTGTLGQFQLVAEGITGTTYTDTLSDSQILGDGLISADWDMPPTGLRGLISLPSGALAGFVENKIYFSEPNQPHAWPTTYALQCDYPIVSLAHFGTGIAVGTISAPYLITGVEPGQMTMEGWKEALLCASKRSMVSLGNAVLYASPAGLVSVSPAGVSIWSLPFFTKDEFAEYAPETMVSALSKGRLYVRYQTQDVTRALIFNLLGDTPYLTETHINADDLFADDVTGDLFFSCKDAIYLFDPLDGYAMPQDWMSKEIVLPRPTNLGAAKVTFDLAIDPALRDAILAEIAAVTAYNAPLLATGNVRGSWASKGFGSTAVGYAKSILKQPPPVPPFNEVSFQLYVRTPNGLQLKFSRVVTHTKPFHLPSGFVTEAIAVRVASQCRIRSIEIGGTKLALATA